MTLTHFKKVIDDINFMVQKTGIKLKRLGFYKDGEPLLNKKLEEMIHYAKKQNVADSLYLTTNAALLTPERSLKLIESGLDDIRISVEATSSKEYRRITQTFDDYDTILKNVGFLYQEKTRLNQPLTVIAQIIDADLNSEIKQQFLDDFSPITDRCDLKKIMGWSGSGQNDFTHGLKKNTPTPRLVCPEPFSKLAVNFNRTVSICCVDWTHETVVGDLSQQTLEEVWQGETLKNFRIKHLKGQRHTLPPCTDCHYLQTRSPIHVQDMDEQASELLTRFQ